MTCRKAHGAVFNPFIVFLRTAVEITGEARSWESSPGDLRWFCNACGSRVFETCGDHIEISMGSFDKANAFSPQYEMWVMHREAWLPPLLVPQFACNRE